MKQTAQTLHDIHRHIGTITDLSSLCEVQNDALMFAPELTDNDLQSITAATQKRLWCEKGGVRIDFHRDGKRILSFATAYQKRREDIWTDLQETQETETSWMLRKMVLRLFVELTEQDVKQKCVDWLNLELQESDWQLFSENGCGFLKKEPAMQETTEEEKRALARAYREVRDDMTAHLIRFWLELFEQHGVAGAKSWIRENWQPLDDETREKINAAYTAARKDYAKTNDDHTPGKTGSA